MKKQLLVLFVFLVCAGTAAVAQQTDTVKRANQTRHSDYWDDHKLIDGKLKDEIDPRQYVRVLYKKNINYKQNEKTEVQRVIWNWNDSGYFQKFKVLDNEGFLNIFFKKDSLANNYNFKGNISLEAQLKGKDGERKIEVTPYSLVGVERKEIGIESFAPTTVAQLLFNTIIGIKRTIVSIDFNLYDDAGRGFKDDSLAFVEAVDLLEVKPRRVMDSLVNANDRALQIIKERLAKDTLSRLTELEAVITNPDELTHRKLISELKEAINESKSSVDVSSGLGAIKFYRDLSFLHKELMLINTYLSAFEKAGDDAVQAFLALASKDEINFNYLKKSLTNQESVLSILMRNAENSKNYQSLLNYDNINLALNIMKDLRVFSLIEGSRLEVLVNEYVKDSQVTDNAELIKWELEELNGREVSKETYNRYFEYLGEKGLHPNNFSRYIKLRLLEKNKSFEEFKQKLSVEAARIIYKKLVYASIDLGKSGAQPGDILYLNIVWKNIDGKRDSTESSSSLLPIGKYYLRQTGWRTEISESFYLVERINEPPTGTDNLSRSNFKGAYGASIMRTFHYNDNFERTFPGRFLNWLQPSFGFNISYIDFYANKDIEIGAGLQLGIFRNVFFFGSGINLHGIRNDEKKSAAYFMFGVSFTNIAAKFKNNDPPAQ